MHALNLPAYDASIREVEGKAMIYDPVRRKYVRLTPEEWVRQHFLHYLVQELAVPKALIAVEMAFRYQGMARRADLVVHDRKGHPVLMVECKAPEVEIAQPVFDQVARYNKVVKARYLVVTNGLLHIAAVIDPAQRSYVFLEALPTYDEL